jgi:hypothetical protein
MTRYTGPNAASGTDLLPSSDPGSTAALLARRRESFLRVRKDRLAVGPFRVRPERRYDDARLRRDLASVREAGRDPRVLAARLADGADEREELRRRGWTDERLASAQEGLRDDLQGRVHPPRRPPLIAGGGPGGSGSPQSRPPLAASLTAAAFPGWCRWHQVVMTGDVGDSSSRLRGYLDHYDEHVKVMGEPCPACLVVLKQGPRMQKEGLVASAATPPALVASAVEGRRLIADDLSTLTGSGGPQRASGFALRHFASEWWLCRNVGGLWTNTGYAARGGRWWRWTKDRLVETNLPAPHPDRRRAHGLAASPGSDRSIYGLLPPVAASSSPSRATTPSGANRDAPGGRAPRRRGGGNR